MVLSSLIYKQLSNPSVRNIIYTIIVMADTLKTKDIAHLPNSTKYTAVQPKAIQNLLFPKRTWTDDEDELLKKVVNKFGAQKWSHIAKYIPNRMGKQCR